MVKITQSYRRGSPFRGSGGCTVIFLLFCCPVFSQNNPPADSLARLLRTARPDTAKVNLLNDLAWELKAEHPEQAKIHLDSALQLASRLRFKKGEGNAFNLRGVVEDMHGNSPAALDFFQKAKAIREALGDRRGVASLLNNMGNVLENQGDYLGALASYQATLKLREELRDTAKIVRTYYNIANVLEAMANYPEALEYIYQYLEGAERAADEEGVANAWNIIGNLKTETDRYNEALRAYEKSLMLHRKLGNEWEEATVLNNIANLSDTRAEDLMDQKVFADSVEQMFGQAIEMHRQALAIRTRLEDRSGQAEIFNNIGYVLKNLGSFYEGKKNLAQATKTWLETEKYFRQSLEIRQAEGDKAGIMEIYNGIADVRRRQERYLEALDYTRRYFAIAKEIGDRKFQQSALKDLARIYAKMGRFQEAYEYREQYDVLRYTLFQEEQIKTEARREAVYSDRKKQQEIERQEQALQLQDAQLQTAATVRNSLLGGAALLLLLAVLMLNRTQVIRREKKRSEDLLLNILPAQTAEELKAFGQAKARRHEAVSVLFSDFKSFTTIAEQTTPEALVAELDECFRAFDDITAHHGIEKIKTIGDAYLCAAGLPAPQSDHAGRMVQAALEMQAFMAGFQEKQRLAGKPEFFCRIGIHSGPVVAGVVGRRKFAYDIWGDTVNLAARMEQGGEAGRVNISQATFELVREKFKCTHRGKLEAKGKGEVEMYFVEGRG